MDFSEYQKKAREFAVYPKLGENVAYPTLGLCGEAGEVANQVKKVLRDDNGQVYAERREKIIDELGDVLWYIANLAEELNENLDFIARDNLRKLTNRRAYDLIHGDKRNG